MVANERHKPVLVAFTLERGEIFGLLGPNGAGKTTVVECVIRLREPDEGEIVICGINARQHPRDVKQKIGAALQTTSVWRLIWVIGVVDRFRQTRDHLHLFKPCRMVYMFP
jgi:ABC-2 type transport system ATP-binding protein